MAVCNEMKIVFKDKNDKEGKVFSDDDEFLGIAELIEIMGRNEELKELISTTITLKDGNKIRTFNYVGIEVGE